MEKKVQYKFTVPDLEKFRKQVAEKSIKFTEPVAHEYTYFKVPNKEVFTVLRIKESVGKAFVDMKTRTEDTGEWDHFESEVKNPEQVRNILIKTGCTPIVTFHKTRETFVNNTIRMDIDSIKELRTFLEVKFNLNQKQEAVDILTELGINPDDYDKRSIVEIYLEEKA